MRLDQHLTTLADLKSRSAAQKLIVGGFVKVGARVIKKPAFTLSGSEVVTWTLPAEPAIPEGADSDVKLTVLYEDDACMVIDKPADLTVHPGNGTAPGEATVLSSLKRLFRSRKLPFSESEVLVHRLDKDTTGCLLIAKTPKAHLALQKQFASRTVDKRYLTIVQGVPSPAAAVIDAPIGRHVTKRTTMTVHQAVKSRAAKTTYRTRSTANNLALLECELHTGRTHQIRVHLRSINHPVIGDPAYFTVASSTASEKLGATSICLHAWKLTFNSPALKKSVSVVSKLPPSFNQVLKAAELTAPKA